MWSLYVSKNAITPLHFLLVFPPLPCVLLPILTFKIHLFVYYTCTTVPESPPQTAFTLNALMKCNTKGTWKFKHQPLAVKIFADVKNFGRMTGYKILQWTKGFRNIYGNKSAHLQQYVDKYSLIIIKFMHL